MPVASNNLIPVDSRSVEAIGLRIIGVVGHGVLVPCKVARREVHGVACYRCELGLLMVSVDVNVRLGERKSRSVIVYKEDFSMCWAAHMGRATLLELCRLSSGASPGLLTISRFRISATAG